MAPAQLIIKTLAALGLLVAGTALILNLSGPPVPRAVVLMGWGLIMLWVVACGTITYALRDRIRSIVLGINLDWKLKFVLFATVLALLEEAVATLMTNLAPLFGANVGEAYITASADYLDVVAFHSVIMFVPQFMALAWLLSRYDFKPAQVFLLYGFLGTFNEALFGGPQQFLAIGMWTFVYGLMAYLPAYCLPEDRGTVRTGRSHFLLAFVITALSSVPVAIALGATGLAHPKTDFSACLPANSCGKVGI